MENDKKNIRAHSLASILIGYGAIATFVTTPVIINKCSRRNELNYTPRQEISQDSLNYHSLQDSLNYEVIKNE